MKAGICATVGVIGSAIAGYLGGWDNALKTLIIFMTVDYITGIMVAGIFHNSNKTEHGTLESRAGFKGLFRKGLILCFVLIGQRLDIMCGSDFIRNAVVVGFCANDLISITENAGLMGVPIPEPIVKAIDILQDKSKVE